MTKDFIRMSTTEHSFSFHHGEDCVQTGCPGHNAMVSIHNTSGVLRYTVDAREVLIMEEAEFAHLA